MTLKEELNQTINLLESQLPASLADPRNQKLEKQFERNMAEYFRQVEMAFPYAEVENLYIKLVKQE